MSWLLLALLALALATVGYLAYRLQSESRKSQQTAVLAASSAEEIHIARARLLASINSLKLGYIMTDKNGSILLINTAAINLLCNTELENVKVVVSAAPHLDFHCTIEEITEELHQNFDLKTEIKKCLETNKAKEFAEVVFRSFFLHVRLSPIVVDGRAIGTVVLVEDVTDAKNLERSKDEFFSIASHELRTPLTTIRGNAELIEQYYAQVLQDADLKQMIEDIRSSSVRLIGIVNDYLNVSRIEQKRIKFVIEPFDLYQLAAKVVQNLTASVQAKGLSISLLPLTTVAEATVRGDADRTEEVLINLIGNAIKYTDQGTVTVEVQPTLSTVKVLITDTGRGIPVESQASLFRKFNQAASNLYVRDPSKSTGLGLYISKLLIAGMGGMIQLEQSNPGKGSIFAFTLPRPRTEPAKPVLNDSPKSATVQG